jgi:hypothetical protein
MSATKRKPATSGRRRRPYYVLRDEQRQWVRPFHRANNALHSSFRLICSMLHTVAVTERTAHRRPVAASRELHAASEMLITATTRLKWAAHYLGEMTRLAALQPETAGHVPQIVTDATNRWLYYAGWLAETANEVFALHRSLLDGLESGELVPEQSGRRRRIVLAPRTVFVRAFLRIRRARVRDRIAPLLRRRRRTPRPAALTVPRPGVLGRAPPVFVDCLR